MSSNNPFADSAAHPRAPRSAASSEDLESLSAAVNQPLPYESESRRGSTHLGVPGTTGTQTPNRASGFDQAGTNTPRDSVLGRPQSSAAESALLLNDHDEKRASALSTGAGVGVLGTDASSEEVVPSKERSGTATAAPARRRRRLLLLGGCLLLIIAIAVAVPVAIVTTHKNKSNASGGGSGGSGSSGGSGGGSGGGGKGPTTGGDGSTVTTEDGQTFTYNNKFGGIWIDDPKDPFNNNAQPNSWTPPLNTSWTWGKDRVYG